jgi:hypothetical protein
MSTEELVGRTGRVVGGCLGNPRQRSKLFLVGPTRFGKISILKTPEDRPSTTDAVVLRFDVEGYPGSDTL